MAAGKHIPALPLEARHARSLYAQPAGPTCDRPPLDWPQIPATFDTQTDAEVACFAEATDPSTAANQALHILRTARPASNGTHYRYGLVATSGADDAWLRLVHDAGMALKQRAAEDAEHTTARQRFGRVEL